MILAETIGVWFLNREMNIPTDRMLAANWVFQLSIITFIINLVSVPYNAVIIAHEKMSAFAYISIFEALGKLVIAFLIVVSNFLCCIDVCCCINNTNYLWILLPILF